MAIQCARACVGIQFCPVPIIDRHVLERMQTRPGGNRAAMKKIPVAAPDLSSLEEEYVLDAVRSTWISSTGPYLTRFETEFSAICGVKHVYPVSNGTVALHLALMAHGIGPG